MCASWSKEFLQREGGPPSQKKRIKFADFFLMKHKIIQKVFPILPQNGCNSLRTTYGQPTCTSHAESTILGQTQSTFQGSPVAGLQNLDESVYWKEWHRWTWIIGFFFLVGSHPLNTSMHDFPSFWKLVHQQSNIMFPCFLVYPITLWDIFTYFFVFVDPTPSTICGSKPGSVRNEQTITFICSSFHTENHGKSDWISYYGHAIKFAQPYLCPHRYTFYFDS